MPGIARHVCFKLLDLLTVNCNACILERGRRGEYKGNRVVLVLIVVNNYGVCGNNGVKVGLSANKCAGEVGIVSACACLGRGEYVHLLLVSCRLVNYFPSVAVVVNTVAESDDRNVGKSDLVSIVNGVTEVVVEPGYAEDREGVGGLGVLGVPELNAVEGDVACPGRSVVITHINNVVVRTVNVNYSIDNGCFTCADKVELVNCGILDK